MTATDYDIPDDLDQDSGGAQKRDEGMFLLQFYYALLLPLNTILNENHPLNVAVSEYRVQCL